MRIRYSEPARRDVLRIMEFYAANGAQSDEVDSYLDSIMRGILILEDQPEIGFLIGAKYGMKLPYRGLVVWERRYLAVYEVNAEHIDIKRIYSTKENFVTDLISLSS
ncbi:MAG: type II toxin-antitoxin system RelE/ParE family toxin [Coriobacteriia bacterium]|nr:type II toxin-antitoxin system RelE/ParE family toxin [Coriobacteriia bacterium]MCL2537457.1 type II toxin-antitoxin system RelE/ParE family toxin [Coriobacteriia bacterium]